MEKISLKEKVKNHGWSGLIFILAIFAAVLFWRWFSVLEKHSLVDACATVLTFALTAAGALYQFEKGKLDDIENTKKKKRTDNQQVIVSLLNLIDEFPDIADERLRWSEVTESKEEKVNYSPFKDEIVAFKREFHDKINNVKNTLSEYSLSDTSDGVEKNTEAYLREEEVSLQANLVQKNIAILTTQVQTAANYRDNSVPDELKAEIQVAKDTAALEMFKLIAVLKENSKEIIRSDAFIDTLSGHYKLLAAYLQQYTYLDNLRALFESKKDFPVDPYIDGEKQLAISFDKLTCKENVDEVLSLLKINWDEDIHSLDGYQKKYYNAEAEQEDNFNNMGTLRVMLKDLLMRNALRAEKGFQVSINVKDLNSGTDIIITAKQKDTDQFFTYFSNEINNTGEKIFKDYKKK